MKYKILLLLVAISIIFSSESADGQTKIRENKTERKSVLTEKIRQVENNLIPFVPVKNFKGWNIADRMKYYNVSGASIAVIKDFKIDWAKGYGIADKAKNMPVTTETMFSAGSISKFVAAVAAFDLVQNGKMDLDAPINNYLTSWKIAENDFTRKTPITLRMLLSHTAGTSQASYFGFTPDKKLPTIVEILSGGTSSESRPVVVNSEPKKEFRYSGGGSLVAQMAMMDVSKQKFEDLTQATIFNKLGMKNSTFAQPLPEKFQRQAAWAYSNASWFKGMPYVYPQQAAAGLYSTPTDLAKFLIDVQKSFRGEGKILRQEFAKEMLTRQANVSDGSYKEQIAVGPFLIQRTDNNNDQRGIYFEFTGVNAGFLAYAIANLTTGDGVVVMLNSGDDVNGLGKEIRRAVAKTYGWYKFLPEEITPIKLETVELEKYAGRYRKSVDEVVYIRRENDYLVETINGGSDIYCFPVAKDTIVFTDYNVKGTFGRDASGNVISLKSEWQNEPMPKMKADEFSPSELLNAKKYREAKEAFRQMNLNEYQITYLAYELLNRKPLDSEAVKTILELAAEQHPKSSIVFARWGDFYLSVGDKINAAKNYQKALEIDPTDKQIIEKLKELAK
jgi:CubicO group peptidase (beta-lactamase class C family)